MVWLVAAASVLFVAALGGEGTQLKASLAQAWIVIPGYYDLDALWLAAKIVNVAVNAVVLASLVVRYRAETGVLRHQVRWLMLAALLSAAALVPQPLVGVGPVPLVLALAFIPVAIMFAVLRYRLFDIDLAVRRSACAGSREPRRDSTSPSDGPPPRARGAARRLDLGRHHRGTTPACAGSRTEPSE